MEKIYLLADSAADIEHDVCQQYGIDIIPVRISFGGKTIKEYYDISKEEYWQILSENEEIPQTAQTTPTDYFEAFQKAKKQGCTKVLGIIINAKGSGGFQSANIAREMFYTEVSRDMEIVLLDSGCYTQMYGHIVENAGKMIANGAIFSEILADCTRRIAGVEAFLGVYNLKHLKKSGRISGGTAFVGEALGLKPISKVTGGEVLVLDKVRGDKKLAESLAKKTAQAAFEKEKQTVIVAHALVPEEEIVRLEQALLAEGFAGVIRKKLGASITTNAGPKSIAVIYYAMSVEEPT